jgi:RNA polymerase primary sigma factor
MAISATRDLPLDAQSQVRQHIARITPLKEEEERALWLRSPHERAARDRLVEGYQPLVVAVARTFRHRCQFLDLLDLMQEGSLGIMQAIEARDRRSSETPIRVWVARWIRSAMLRAIYSQERGIRLPDRVRKRLAKVTAAQAELVHTFGRQPSVNELAAHTGLTAEVVTSLLLIQAERVISLEAEAEASESVPLQVAETVPAPVDSPQTHLIERLRYELAQLPAREQAVIRHRYGLDGETAKSTREVAMLLGLTPTVAQDIDRRVRLHLRVALAPQPFPAPGPQVA